MCGTACAPSSSTGTPRALAAAMKRSHRDDRAERVRDVRQRHELRARREQGCERVEVHFAGLGDRDDLQRGARLLAEHLPGHDVRVVLEPRDQDLVARAEARPAVALRDEVDGLGRAAHEDDLPRRARVDEAAHLLARALEQVGRLLAQRVHATMHVGVRRLVVMRDGVDDGAAAAGSRRRCRGSESGWPWTVRASTGKSRRIAATSSARRLRLATA